jgi:GNAT superfamily N-acetyltransferase
MRLRTVGYKHYILSGGRDGFKEEMGSLDNAPKQLTSSSTRRFWYDHLTCIDLKQACAVIITHEGRIIAFFRYILNDAKLTAIGTWVAPKYRRLGLAKRMWVYVLARKKVKQIGVYTISKGGDMLIKKITLLYPNIIWADY